MAIDGREGYYQATANLDGKQCSTMLGFNLGRAALYRLLR